MPNVKVKQRPPAVAKPPEDPFAGVWGRNPFAPPDEADGAQLGGIRLVRDPATGQLMTGTVRRPDR